MSQVTVMDQAGPAAPVRSGAGTAARRFRKARRHSRIVRFLRIALPTISVVATAMVVTFVWFNPLRNILKLPVDAGRLVVSGTKITMEQPRLSGFTRDSRAYELTADAASQDLTRPDLVELQGMRALIGLQDNGSIELTAPLGIFDRKLETLRLERQIRLVSTAGYECELQEATVEVRKGTLVSEKPVSVKMTSGTLTANRLEVLDSGQLVRFDQGVRMVIKPGSEMTSRIDQRTTIR